MSLHDKRSETRRGNLELLKGNPNRAEELAFQRQGEELPHRLEHLQALQELGGRLLMDPALRQTLTAAASYGEAPPAGNATISGIANGAAEYLAGDRVARSRSVPMRRILPHAREHIFDERNDRRV